MKIADKPLSDKVADLVAVALSRQFSEEGKLLCGLKLDDVEVRQVSELIAFLETDAVSDIEKALDATLDLASENQRLRARVAELEEHVRKGDRFIGAVERADKAEAERDTLVGLLVRLFDWGDASYLHAALHVENAVRNLRAEVSTLRAEANEHMSEMASVACGFAWDLGVRSNIPAWFEQAFFRAQRDDAIARADKLQAEAALAQVAVLREALEGVANSVANEHLATDGRFSYAFHDAIKAVEAALAATPAPTRAEAEAWLRAGEPVRGALAVPAEPDYSGLCAAPSCEGHCGYVHARGCEAVREYLADHGGDPYRAPSKEATRG